MQDFSYRTKPMLSVADPDLEPSWGGGRFFAAYPAAFSSFCDSFFFFFTQNKGVGGGGTDPRVPTFDPLLHILRTPYTWGNECWIWIMLYVYGLFRPFQRTYLLEARSLITTKRKNQFNLLLPPLRTPEECYLIDNYFGSRHWQWYWIYPQAPNCKQLLDEVFVISRII